MLDRYSNSLALMVLLTLTLLLGASFPTMVSAAREEVVEARGIAQFSGKKEQGREQALAEAFRHAVTQAVGVMVESESLVQNQLLVTDVVLSRSAGFIKSYSIISESESDGVYTVNIRAVVSEVKLKKALDTIGVTVRKMGKPRIMLLVTESSADAKPNPGLAPQWGDGVAETRIHDLLIKKGFDFVDRRTVSAALKNNPAFAANIGSPPTLEALTEVAKSGEAEIILVGTASSRSASTTIAGTGIYPCQATVAVKAVNADNGEVLASHTAHAVAPHVNPAAGQANALGKAAGEVAERLAQQVLANWKGKVEGTRTVKLVVSGLGGYEELTLFLHTLKEKVDEVEEIWERSFESTTAKIDIEIASSYRNLADRLSSLSVKGKPVKVTSFTSNVFEVTLGTITGPTNESTD